MVAAKRFTLRDFLERLRAALTDALPPDLGRPASRVRFASLQIDFGEPRLHYEIWPVRKTGRIEIGLHIEGPRDWSRDVAACLAARSDDLRSALGDGYELEDWTESWCRLHTTLPYTALNEPLLRDLTAHARHLICAVEPVVRSLDLPDLAPRVVPSASGRGHWRSRRRGRVRP